MKWLGPLLLIGVFARHNLTWLPGYSPAEWFYVLGGVWELALCAALLPFLSTSSLATAALWIGILEGAQVTVCGALMGHARPPENVPECDYLTGWHVGAIMTGVYLFIVCPAIGKAWRGYLGRRYEVGLGVTLAVIVAIGGNEIAHLVSPIAALLVMAGACIAGIAAYERAT